MKWSNTGKAKVKSYTRIAVHHCRMRLGLSQSQKSFILLYLYSLNFAKTQTVILYLKRPLILFFCPQYGPQRHTMLSEISTIIL